MAARKLVLGLSSLAAAEAKKAFVLLGATGDNAYRPAGVWTGLFEAWCGGIFDGTPTDIHVQINQGHTVDEVHEKLMGTLSPFYDDIRKEKAWTCRIADCSPETFYASFTLNIWNGMGRHNSSGQAANMSYLAAYDEVIAYLSIPPSAYQEWTQAAVKYWGGGKKVQIAVEKPFGGGRDSLQDAQDLYKSIIDSGLPEGSLHLTDHWLSFFMNEHLTKFRDIITARLGIDWSAKHIEKIVVTEYEGRGFGGRGSFIDGLGQVRDMVQSHLLQVLALTLMDSEAGIDAAKLEIFNALALHSCELKQFDGLLRSKGLKYHGDFADSTWSRVHVNSSLAQWKDVELTIQTGKAMDVNLYTIDVYQRDGPGVLTLDIGKEEVGTGDIKVKNWKLKDASTFMAPTPGFGTSGSVAIAPEVDADGNGYILRYDDADLYFPKPYSKIVTALISGAYGAAFVTFPECKKTWEIVTGLSPSQCLDPKPEDVSVYLPAFLCDMDAPAMCEQHVTVQDLYDHTYSCTAEHDAWYADVDFYAAKCKHEAPLLI